MWEQGLCWELDSRSFMHNLAENNVYFFSVSRTLGILRIMGAGLMSGLVSTKAQIFYLFACLFF